MFVLDTNVVSELRKVRLGKTDMNVTAWTQSVDAADLFVSAITIMELELGVLSIERKDPAQGALLRLQHPCCRNTPGRQTVCGPDPLDCPRSHGLGAARPQWILEEAEPATNPGKFAIRPLSRIHVIISRRPYVCSAARKPLTRKQLKASARCCMEDANRRPVRWRWMFTLTEPSKSVNNPALKDGACKTPQA